MNEKILSTIRHILTFAGGYVVAKGWIDTPGMESLIGGVMAAVGLVWSIMRHKTPAQ
jgi:hypothetical protein